MMRRTIGVPGRGLPLAAVVALSFTWPSVAQDPAPGQRAPDRQPAVTYTVDVEAVEVDAIVTDAQGRRIADLRQDELQVLEDGAPQRIDAFRLVDIPISRVRDAAPSGAAREPDVRTNARPPVSRLYVLLLDDVHTSPTRTGFVTTAARRFVESSLGPDDLAAVVHLAGPRVAGQDFTTSRPLLLAAIDRFQGRKLPSATANQIEDYNRQVTFTARPGAVRAITDIDEGPRAHDARAAFDAIGLIARRLEALPGRRKALLWFGEGVDYDMHDVLQRTQASVVLDRARAAIAAATRANLTVYGIDARGLRGANDDLARLGNLPADATTGLGLGGLSQELLRAHENLRRLSESTGGFAVTSTSELDGAFDRVVEDTSAYYLIGYTSTNDRRDGTFRRIEVRVTRPGAVVRARAGYVAAKETVKGETPDVSSGAPSALRDALSSVFPKSALPMGVHAASFRGHGGKASVLVTVEYAASAFRSGRTDHGGERLDASVVAVDAAGQVHDSSHTTIGLDVRDETRRAIETLGFRTHARLDLPPGRYQLRVAGIATGTGDVGSVHYDIEVPDYSAMAIALSGLVVTSARAAHTPTARPDDRLRRALPGPPTTVRNFRVDDTIACFVEAYARNGSPSAVASLAISVRDEAGRIVFSQDGTGPSHASRDEATAGDGPTARIPLQDFAPGRYTLRVEARPRAGGGTAPVEQELEFRVWPLQRPETANREVAGPGVSPATADTAELSRDPGTSPPSPAEANRERAGSPAPALPVVGVVWGAVSGILDAGQVVARTADEWHALWGRLPQRRQAPTVKFEDTMAVAIFLGARPTAGYAVEIAGARLDGDTLVVEYRERTPPADSGNPPVTTSPYAVAGVPMHAGPVRFERIGTDVR
jgi:VWFA-related protein